MLDSQPNKKEEKQLNKDDIEDIFAWYFGTADNNQLSEKLEHLHMLVKDLQENRDKKRTVAFYFKTFIENIDKILLINSESYNKDPVPDFIEKISQLPFFFKNLFFEVQSTSSKRPLSSQQLSKLWTSMIKYSLKTETLPGFITLFNSFLKTEQGHNGSRPVKLKDCLSIIKSIEEHDEQHKDDSDLKTTSPEYLELICKTLLHIEEGNSNNLRECLAFKKQLFFKLEKFLKQKPFKDDLEEKVSVLRKFFKELYFIESRPLCRSEMSRFKTLETAVKILYRCFSSNPEMIIGCLQNMEIFKGSEEQPVESVGPKTELLSMIYKYLGWSKNPDLIALNLGEYIKTFVYNEIKPFLITDTKVTDRFLSGNTGIINKILADKNFNKILDSLEKESSLPYLVFALENLFTFCPTVAESLAKRYISLVEESACKFLETSETTEINDTLFLSQSQQRIDNVKMQLVFLLSRLAKFSSKEKQREHMSLFLKACEIFEKKASKIKTDDFQDKYLKQNLNSKILDTVFFSEHLSYPTRKTFIENIDILFPDEMDRIIAVFQVLNSIPYKRNGTYNIKTDLDCSENKFFMFEEKPVNLKKNLKIIGNNISKRELAILFDSVLKTVSEEISVEIKKLELLKSLMKTANSISLYYKADTKEFKELILERQKTLRSSLTKQASLNDIASIIDRQTESITSMKNLLRERVEENPLYFKNMTGFLNNEKKKRVFSKDSSEALVRFLFLFTDISSFEKRCLAKTLVKETDYMNKYLDEYIINSEYPFEIMSFIETTSLIVACGDKKPLNFSSTQAEFLLKKMIEFLKKEFSVRDSHNKTMEFFNKYLIGPGQKIVSVPEDQKTEKMKEYEKVYFATAGVAVATDVSSQSNIIDFDLF